MVELLVVILIIIIIAAASIPMGLNYVRTYKIIGAAQNIATQIQQARGQAVKLNASRGVLLVFNYPQPDEYQYTSLEPDPRDGTWDGNFYPVNPGVFVPGTTVNYGTVPDPPANLTHPNPAGGVFSPHGVPIELAQDISFAVGARNALLFRSDGSVAAVNAAGPIGNPSLTQAPNGDWYVRVQDATTNLFRVVRVSTGGRVRVDEVMP